MMVDIVFHLLIMSLALVYSKFARLPVMVIGNILLFTAVGSFIEKVWDVSLTPGYEIYYAVGAVYFVVMAIIFSSIKDKLYGFIALVMVVHAASSASMLIWDGFWLYHEFVNEHMITVQSIIVWISSVRYHANRSH